MVAEIGIVPFQNGEIMLSFESYQGAIIHLKKEGYKFLSDFSNRGDVHKHYYKGQRVVLLNGSFVPYEGYKYYLQEVK